MKEKRQEQLEKLEEEREDNDVGDVEMGQSAFESYQSKCIYFSIESGGPTSRDHPDKVSETTSMHAVDLPKPKHQIALPREIIEQGLLSTLQLESIIYASLSQENFLPLGANSDAPQTRYGFLLGDGAGMGKGRQIAGLFYENCLRGRNKGCWFSISSDLSVDCRRDFDDIGFAGLNLHNFKNFSANENIKAIDGVLFSTYNLLSQKAQRGKKVCRLDRIVEWLGTDFEGLLVFDESHKGS